MSALTFQMVLDAANLIGDNPKVGIYSSSLFFADRTFSFTADDGETFHIAAPAFWERIAARVLTDHLSQPTGFLGRSLYGIPLIDLDNNTEEAIRVGKAMAKAVSTWRPDFEPRQRHPWPGPEVV